MSGGGGSVVGIMVVDGGSVVSEDPSMDDGEPAVAARSQSQNHGQASSKRCFIPLILLAHHNRLLLNALRLHHFT